MPNQNRTEKDANRLKGVNLLDDPIDIEFGSFTNLANWVHGQLYSIKKKRGVASVPTGAQLPITLCPVVLGVNELVCGTELIMACGEVIIAISGADIIISNLDNEAITSNGNEIGCA